MDEARDSGAKYAFIHFNVHRLYSNSKSIESLDDQSIREYQSLVRYAVKLNLLVIGSSSVWVFPDGGNAPTLPLGKSYSFTVTDYVKKFVIPEFSDEGYIKTCQLRNAMWARIAQSFPGVNLWLVGNEEFFEFIDPLGERLEQKRLTQFIVDSLAGIRESLISVGTGNKVIAHFLGNKENPIKFFVDGSKATVSVQPRDFWECLKNEMIRRNKSVGDFYDFSIADWDPSLLNDRFETTIPPPVMENPNLSLKRLKIETTLTQTPGWNIYNLVDFFEIPSKYDANLNDTSSNAPHPYFPGWMPLYDCPSPVDPFYDYRQSIPVNTGHAHLTMRQIDHLGPATRSKPTVDFVPNESFTSNPAIGEKNSWTAVMDFKAKNPNNYSQTPNGHMAVGIRVNDTVITSTSVEINGQNVGLTRFATTVYPKDNTHTTAYAKLQLTGRLFNQSNVANYCIDFPIGEDPWINYNTDYRLQIYEKEVHVVMGIYLTQWKAEVLKYISPTSLVSIGSTDWIREDQIRNTGGIAIPDLITSTGIPSGILFAFVYNPVCEIDTKRVGTAYWVY